MIELREVLSIGAALLAFILSFYALTARERKAPSVIASVYSTAALILTALFLSLLSKLVHVWSPFTADSLLIIGTVLLFLSTLLILTGIWRLHNRTRNFRTDNLFKNLFFIRWLRSKSRALRRAKPYEHDVEPLNTAVLRELENLPQVEPHAFQSACASLRVGGRNLSLISTAVSPSYAIGDLFASQVAYIFLKHGAWVQYTACSRHPAEFIGALKDLWEKDSSNGHSWPDAAEHTIVVDAFTPHFGFTDSVHLEMNAWLAREARIHSVTIKPTFAGIHTGTARAFNLLKKRQKSQTPRKSTLVCYEGVYSLVDIESVEQYRTFVRHVATSERLWGGMFTLFLEDASCPDPQLRLLKSYSSLYLELSLNSAQSESLR